MDNGYVRGDYAGGFAGEFLSGKLNTNVSVIKEGITLPKNYDPVNDAPYTTGTGTDMHSRYTTGTVEHPYSVYNIGHVRGGEYAGGWGAFVQSSGLATAGGGGISLLGGTGASIDVKQLLTVAEAYVPIIQYAGVSSANGYQVLAANSEIGQAAASKGIAGGYIGYGSGVQVSHCDVDHLAHGNPTEPTALSAAENAAYGRIGISPDPLESNDGSNYMGWTWSSPAVDDDPYQNEIKGIPFAVAGVTHAGGYIGHMDVGNAASIGEGLNLLSELDLTKLLGAVGAVVSTIEHSDVQKTIGGYSVVASSHVNRGDGAFDTKGLGHAGGFAGQVSGGHIQESNAWFFYYVVGEISAGGYVGEMVPGDLAKVLDRASLEKPKKNADGSIVYDDEGNPVMERTLLGTLIRGLSASDLLSLAQDFVPSIRNSACSCVPCGGAVRAEKPSDGSAGGGVVRGMAGGYVGHNKGGQIWGIDQRRWKDIDNYPGAGILNNSLSDLGIEDIGNFWGLLTGEASVSDSIASILNIDADEYTNGLVRECAAIRIRSVYGAEYAGGYCGLMECASTAEAAGGLSVLGGLLEVDNLLGALQAVYPTTEAGTVYGPLYGVDEDTWNAWKTYVGATGGFASELVSMSYEQASSIEYGTNVVAGRHVYDRNATTALSGCAGGFVGAMHGGAISGAELVDEVELDHPSYAVDTKVVLAMRAAGGFAGEMQTKGLAEAGTVKLLGIQLNLGSLVGGLAQVFVPAISTSGTTGYQKGMRVGATGTNDMADDDSASVQNADAAYQRGVGCAGGYVGACYGGQIGISDDKTNIVLERLQQWIAGHQDLGGAWARNLKEVKGTRDIGGFVGRTSSASVLNADTDSVSNGFVQNLLSSVVDSPSDLLNVLQATIATIKYAKVSASDPNWGIVVDGTYTVNGSTGYAKTAGGFAGSLEAAVVGELNNDLDIIRLDNLRGVVGGEYAGGFFGLADVGTLQTSATAARRACSSCCAWATRASSTRLGRMYTRPR